MRSLTFYIAYFGLLLTDLILIYSHPAGQSRLLLEPLMIILLILHFRQHYSKEHSCDPKFVMIALGSILLGGLFLTDNFPMYSFLAGFCFFLVANIAYTLLFYRCADIRMNRVLPFITIASILAMGILYIFYDELGDYFIPASFYLFVLLNCMQAAFLRYKMVNSTSFYFIFTGTVFFFIAQIVAAFHYFLNPSPVFDFIIMGTFFTSQFLIVEGMLKNTEDPIRVMENPIGTQAQTNPTEEKV